MGEDVAGARSRISLVSRLTGTGSSCDGGAGVASIERMLALSGLTRADWVHRSPGCALFWFLLDGCPVRKDHPNMPDRTMNLDFLGICAVTEWCSTWCVLQFRGVEVDVKKDGCRRLPLKWVNCLKTLNKLTMYLPGITPSAPSRRRSLSIFWIPLVRLEILMRYFLHCRDPRLRLQHMPGEWG